MSYLITTVEQLTKNQIEVERKDYLHKPIEEQGSYGVKLLKEDFKKTKPLDLANKIMRSQQTQIQAHESKLVDHYLVLKLILILLAINL